MSAGGNEVVLVDLNGDVRRMASATLNEMAIQLQIFTGPLTSANFILL